ncbi:MAG: DoxX family protein [Acidobacteria bacterium]|nr:DoxX family protein [Acidobacteriota bacterium]
MSSESPSWRPATRVAFRFCFVYFGLYSLVTQIVGGLFLLPTFQLPALGMVWPMRDLALWSAEHLFGVTGPIVYVGNSGDTALHWIQTLWMLIVALAATAVWSMWDDRRLHYVTLHKWFRAFVRLALAAQMFYYGMAKVIPTQFPRPSLVTLVEPVGNLSLTDLLWTSIGASVGYQMFTGWAEMLAGFLLLVPRTTTLGALVCLADMVMVFMLNMTYDFGLKQISFHLILLSLFLLAPDVGRLADMFVLNRPAGPSTQPPLFRTARANRVALAVQIVWGLYLVGMFANLNLGYWYTEPGNRAPRSPLYGIWDVKELEIDGEVRLPALNDYDRRWRRVIFDVPSVVAFQRTDDSIAHYGVSVDVGRRTVALNKGRSKNWQASFTYDRPARDRLILDGEMDGYTIRMQLTLVELDTFRLLNSRFRWIRPPSPYAG